jgi:RNA polymerase sigma factor (TIGR02999 family)
MPASRQPTVTALLVAWSHGDASALEYLVPLVYAELHRLAHQYMRRERQGHALDTTALVHEAYVRLASTHRIACEDRVHFFAVCAGLMRRILVDIARQEHALKRGGHARRVPLDEALTPLPSAGPAIIQVDDALRALAAIHPRQARIVELRYFGGLSVEETASALGLSRATVLREWRLARKWLAHELSREEAG